MRRVLYWGIAVVAAVLLLLGGNTFARYAGWGTEKMSPNALAELLRPAYRVQFPDGQGPWPMALLFSGCDGPKDNMDRWSSAMTALGWGAMVVDSHGPRGFDDAQIWRLICAGQLLPGAERAGDVAVAWADARAMERVDSGRIVLMGASHGGWSILDLLSLHGRGKRPHNLASWPESLVGGGLDGLAGVILFYPYCGPGSQVARHGWDEDVPALFLLVEGDTIADEQDCLELAQDMAARGFDVEVHVLEGTTHGFDQETKNAFSALEFSPEATAEAAGVVAAFLERAGGEGGSSVSTAR